MRTKNDNGGYGDADLTRNHSSNASARRRATEISPSIVKLINARQASELNAKHAVSQTAFSFH